MANSFNVPFDFNPTSISVKTSSYTIPAGSYAYVVNSSMDDFTIDGAAAVQNADSYVVQLTSVSYFDYTITQGGNFTIAHFVTWQSGTAQMTTSIAPDGSNFYTLLSSTIGSGNDTKYVNVHLNKGAVVRFARNSSANSNTYGYISSCRESIVSGGFWVPSGTQLNGDRYTVALFNEIS